jgi:hypothetical protein
VAQQSEKRLILVAPDDVESEIDTIRAVIDQANQLRRNQRLTPWYWRTDSTPGLHLDGPQGKTDEQMRISEADLVIAIFWSRLGTPVLDEQSGTAHELKLAWESWRVKGKPDVWIYFCQRDIPQAALADPNQFPALMTFRSSVAAQQKCSEFRTLEELHSDFTQHLGLWLHEKDSELQESLAEPQEVQVEPQEILVGPQGVLVPPDASRSVPRLDQQRRLRRSFAEASIVCLHGISGSGKTQLAAQYVSSTQRLVEHSREALWYDVPEGGTLEEMLAVMPAEFVGSNDLNSVPKLKNLLTTLRLRRQLLVLDDFHRVDRTSYAPFLRIAGSQSTPGSVLLLSRTALYAPGAKEVPIRPWTTSEVGKLLEQLGGPALTDALLLQLTQRTGGLPLAVTFFSVLVKTLRHDARRLLKGKLTQTPLTENWYSEIKDQLSEAELALLRYFSLAEPYITEPVLKRAEERLVRAERSRAFIRLQTLLLVESRRASRWVVHPFVAEHTLNDTDDDTRRTLLRDLCSFSRAGIRNQRPWQITQQSLAAGIRACRYAQRADDVRQSAAIIRKIASASKRLGHYESLRDLSQWQMTIEPDCDPWIKYHYSHCELILGNARMAATVLSALKPNNSDLALVFASARILAEARSQIGMLDDAILELKRVLARKPHMSKGEITTYRQAQATLTSLLIKDRRLGEAAVVAQEVARTAGDDDLSLAVIMMHLGQIDHDASPRSAEIRFRRALSKFRSVGDRRGIAWAQRSVAECILRRPDGNRGEARRLAREAMSTYSRTGESTSDYSEWLEQVRPLFGSDAAMLSMVDHERSRLHSDLGLSSSD